MCTHEHTNTHVHPYMYVYVCVCMCIYIYIIHLCGLPKFELSVSIFRYQVFRLAFQNGKAAFDFVLVCVSVYPLLFWSGS